jgi:hypothetical protein
VPGIGPPAAALIGVSVAANPERRSPSSARPRHARSGGYRAVTYADTATGSPDRSPTNGRQIVRVPILTGGALIHIIQSAPEWRPETG